MPVILLIRINLAQEVTVGLWCMAHPLLSTPAVMPSASFFHLLHFGDVFLARFDATGMSQLLVAVGISSWVELESLYLLI